MQPLRFIYTPAIYIYTQSRSANHKWDNFDQIRPMYFIRFINTLLTHYQHIINTLLTYKIIAVMGCQGLSSKQTVPINKSLIHLLVSGQNELIIQKIQSEGKNFDINKRVNFRGDTLLHYACSRGNQQLIQYLLKNNADTTISNKQGQKPLQMIQNILILDLLSSTGIMKKKDKSEYTIQDDSQNKNKITSGSNIDISKKQIQDRNENHGNQARSLANQTKSENVQNQSNLRQSVLKRTAAQADNFLQHYSTKNSEHGKQYQN